MDPTSAAHNPAPATLRPGTVGLVLSGGGARGAYEVGVLSGIVELLGLGPHDAAPFQIFAGTSVGAINAGFLAANAHRGDLGVARLSELWQSLNLDEHLRIDPLGLWGWPRRMPSAIKRRVLGVAALDDSPRFGRSLLDPRPLERLVREGLPWEQLRSNVDAGLVKALVVAALEVGTGRTTLFMDRPSGPSFRASRDPRRIAIDAAIRADHILASAALPMLFPARRIGAHYYIDGGLRFNTPIAPAIRLGAERLMVITVMHQRTRALLQNEPDPDEEARGIAGYPSLLYLAGKLLNAVLLDPVVYDLQILDRFNRLIGTLEKTLTLDEMRRVQDVIVASRGAPYRRLDTLIFSPSEDIGELAGEVVRMRLPRWKAGQMIERLMGSVGDSSRSWEADWASYILFDRAFALRLIEMGRRDAYAREADVRAFFEAPAEGDPSHSDAHTTAEPGAPT